MMNSLSRLDRACEVIQVALLVLTPIISAWCLVSAVLAVDDTARVVVYGLGSAGFLFQHFWMKEMHDGYRYDQETLQRARKSAEHYRSHPLNKAANAAIAAFAPGGASRTVPVSRKTGKGTSGSYCEGVGNGALTNGEAIGFKRLHWSALDGLKSAHGSSIWIEDEQGFPVLTASCIRISPINTDHHAPQETCSCGIYSMNADHTYPECGMSTRIVVMVENSGDIIEGERGYRSEKARVLAAYDEKLERFIPWPEWKQANPAQDTPQAPGVTIHQAPVVTITSSAAWQRFTTTSLLPNG